MRSRTLSVAFLMLGVVFAASCGGSNPAVNIPPQGSSAPLSVTLTDMPPAGITVLSFEVVITGATMQPGNVSLITTPMTVEMKRLEVLKTFLNTVNVPAGTYTSMNVTFANPRMTILNNSGMGMMSGCATGSVCELTPPMMTSSVTMSGPPFPFTVQGNTPMGLLMDFDLFNSIMSDMRVNPALTCSRRSPMQGSGQIDKIEDVLGRVTAKDAGNNQFTLEVMHGARSLTIRVDSSTQFDGFDDLGLANSFTSVAVGQTLEVDLQLLGGGAMLAEKIELEDNDNEEELEGVIVAVSSSTQFDMVLMHEAMDVPGIQPGNRVRMNLLPGTSFRIDDDGLPVGGLSFVSASDLYAGQAVQIEKKSLVPGTPPAIDTDRVKLEQTSFTARVKAKLNATDFTVENLPELFQSPANQFEVRTSSQTDFDGVTGVAAVNAGDTVSVRGLLFKTLGDPVLVASKVRKR